jgi:hypothetical protein
MEYLLDYRLSHVYNHSIDFLGERPSCLVEGVSTLSAMAVRHMFMYFDM